MVIMVYILHFQLRKFLLLILVNSELTITKQITGKSVSSNSLTLTVADALDATAGITSVAYEAFDAERDIQSLKIMVLL